MLFFILAWVFLMIAAAFIKDAYAEPKRDRQRAMREHRVGKVGKPFDKT